MSPPKLKWFVTARSGGSPTPAEDGNIPLFGANGIMGHTNTANCDAGTILVGRVGSSGAVNMISEPGWATDNTLIIESNSNFISTRFLYYTLLAANLPRLVSGTAMPLLTSTAVGEQRVWFPIKNEQERIANFLDEKTARIDALIAEKERLVDSLGELRLSTITKAVGAGHSPSEAPEADASRLYPVRPMGWSLTRLGYLASKIGSGKTPVGGAEVYVSEGIPLIRSMNVYDEGMRMDDVAYITPEMDSELASTRLMPDDILLNITGASIGRTCVVPEDALPANINQHTCIVRLRQRMLVPFVSLAMKSAQTKAQIEAFQNGAAREGLNFTQVARIAVLAPDDLDVAQRVAREVASKLASIDQAIQHTTIHIDSLREYRASLISAAVTGQIAI